MTTHLDTTAVATTTPRVHGLDVSGPMLQRFYSARPVAHGAPNPQIRRIRIPHPPAQASTDGPLRRIDAERPDSHLTNHVHTTDEINTGGSGASNVRAETFVESLPVLLLTDLPEDSRGCPICFEQYQGPQHDDRPVRLSCNHVLGKDCLLSWLTSSAKNTNNNTCPMCRAALFERVGGSTEERLRVVLEELDSQHQMLESEPPRLWRIGNSYRRDAEYYRTLERFRRLGQQSSEAIALLQTMRHDRARRTRRSGLEESREGVEGNEGNFERR